jgi:hypothetical protein
MKAAWVSSASERGCRAEDALPVGYGGFLPKRRVTFLDFIPPVRRVA